MKEDPQITERTSVGAEPKETVRKPVLIIITLLLLLCIGGAILFARRDKAGNTPPSEADATTQPPAQTTVQRSAPAQDDGLKVVDTTGTPVDTQPTTAPVAVPSVRRSTPVVDPAVPRVEPSPATRQMVTALTQLDLAQGPLTPEKAAEWKQNLQQLTLQGAAAVPAIREFLDKNLDLNFDATSGGLLGQSSLRMTFLETLQNIGGPEALAISSQVLQTTLDPKEIAWLARSLEQQAPGQYAQMAANAALEALNMAGTGQQLKGVDVGPLFGVLQQYGGPGAAAELEKLSGQYGYYSTIALGKLPDGAGIPALIQMVQDPQSSKGTRAPALQMLAQAALQSPEAMTTLLEQARLNQIPTGTWLNIASILAGDKVEIGPAPVESGVRSSHVAMGNQSWYTVPDRSAWTPDQINSYTAKIDQFLAVAGNNNAMVVTALQNSRAAVQGRLQQ